MTAPVRGDAPPQSRSVSTSVICLAERAPWNRGEEPGEHPGAPLQVPGNIRALRSAGGMVQWNSEKVGVGHDRPIDPDL
jgi:hypothetical protein